MPLSCDKEGDLIGVESGIVDNRSRPERHNGMPRGTAPQAHVKGDHRRIVVLVISSPRYTVLTPIL
jgi:hypothetical protein